MSTAATALRHAAHERRRERLRESLAEAGIDVLIAYSWGNHAYLDLNPVWYLTGFKQMGAHAALIMPADAAPTLLMTPAWDQARAAEDTGLPVEAIDVTSAPAFIAAALARVPSAGPAVVGLAAGGDPPLADRVPWSATLGREIADATPLVMDIASTKDELQLRLIARATAIAEATHAHMLEQARPGMREYELMAELDAYMRGLGADDAFLLLSASQHNRCVHAATGRVLERGDIVLAEISPSVDGEFIQICRTFVLGRPPSALEGDRFALLTECYERGLAAARPGTTVGAVVEAVNAPLLAAGYDQYVRPPYMRTRGHANGMGAPIPELRPGGDLQLRPGMSFELHPNQYLPETGYLMCGEPVIVEHDGARALTSRRGTLDWVDA